MESLPIYNGSKLVERFENVELDVFQIMPNHMHGIIALNAGDTAAAVRAGFTPALHIHERSAPNIHEPPTQNTDESPDQKNHEPPHPTIQQSPHWEQSQRVTHESPHSEQLPRIIHPSHWEQSQHIDQPSYPGQPQRIAQPTASRATARDCPYGFQNELMGQLWQCNYYEHIIRNEPSYQTIAQYILDNPAKWQADKFYHS